MDDQEHVVEFNGKIIAKSSQCQMMDGNFYFPFDSLNKEYFSEKVTGKQTYCGYKGTADYYDIIVDGKKIENGAWIYQDPMDGAIRIKNYVAFYRKDGLSVN